MVQTVRIEAVARERAGKGAARATRRGGLVPAVVYGAKQEATLIALDPRDVIKELTKGGWQSHLYEVAVKDGPTERSIMRDVQFDPVTDRPIHVDFQRVGKSSRIDVAIPVHFINEDASPGLKRGGVLNVVRHEIECSCPADAIPESLTVDLTGLDIGDSVHINAIKLPAGISPVITERDFTIAAIAGSSAMKPEATAEAAEEAKEE